MEVFNYKAKTEEGEVIEDTIQAASMEDAAFSIKSRNLELLTIRKYKAAREGLFAGKISVSEKATLCRFLATMLRSGMSIPESVEIIQEETKNKKLARILSDVNFQTQKGKSLSSVLAQYPKDFDAVFLTMIRVGEESGTLEKSFDYLSKQLTASYELRQTVTGSMMYPAVIMGAMFGNGLLMMLFVLPRIAGAFLKLDVPLPAYTKIVLTAGQFFGNHVILVLIVLAAMMLGLGLLMMIRGTRHALLKLVVKMPVFRKIMKHIDIARFARTLSTLLKSGVPIVEALDVASGTMTQGSTKKEAGEFSKGVEKGESLSDVLVRHKTLFPSTMIQSIRAGERSGTLEQVLEEMADFYENEVGYTLKKLTSLLEPVLMLLIGVAVGGMVIIMIAPIYSIIGGLQSTIGG